MSKQTIRESWPLISAHGSPTTWLRNCETSIVNRLPVFQYSSIRAEIHLSDVETIAAFPEVRFFSSGRDWIYEQSNRYFVGRSVQPCESRPAVVRHASENVRNKLSSYLANHPADPMFAARLIPKVTEPIARTMPATLLAMPAKE